ncbi:MAG: cytidine deaminase [Phascolarctobacterium sp.]|nr:MAG: cytidine deaminase [Phascolarctobacterium sp.]
MMDAETKKLWQAALEVRKNAYTPYSKFKVGAALLASSGKIYTGCNVENASYGLACCAERNTIFAAVAAGERSFEALCVVAEGAEPVAPCGACRQVIAEFGIPKIIMADLNGNIKIMTADELLPYSFNAASMDNKGEK